MALFQPAAYNQLNSMLGLVGGTTQDLLNQNSPGASSVRSTMRQIGRGPEMALPGGQFFEGGPFAQSVVSDIPAATLPLYQAEAGRKGALTGTQAGVGQAQVEKQGQELTKQQQLQQQLIQLLMGFGAGPLRSAGVGSTFGLLSTLLGI